MGANHQKLSILLIIALAWILLMPSWIIGQRVCNYHGSYNYPLTPDMEEHMWYAEAYKFLYGNNEWYYAPYSALEHNPTSYNMPTYSQNIGGENATYWLNEANIFYLTGSYQQAAESYANAVNFDPSLSKGWLNLGNSLYFLGKYQASLNAYNALLNLEPQNADALAGKSQALLALNKTIGANTSSNTPSTVQGPEIANLGSPKYNGGEIGEPVIVGNHPS